VLSACANSLLDYHVRLKLLKIVMSTTTNAISKVAAVAAGLALVASMFLLAPIAQAATSCSFSADLTIGSKGAAVTCLQNELIARGFSIPAGATGYFGGQTKTAVSAWQKSAGVTPAAGYFGAKSRAAYAGSAMTPTTPTTPVVSGNGLKVMLATDSPNNIALVQSQAAGDLAKFTFSNPTGADVKVTSLTFKRIGVSTDSALSNVYLFDGEKRLTDPAGISNSTFNFNDSTGIFTISAGAMKTVTVRADIAGSTSGQQIGVQLVAAASTATLDSSVSFPINSYTQTVSSASLAAVALGTVTPTNGTFAPATDATVFQSTATVSTRAVWLKSVTFENRGSTVDADFQNLKLLVKGTQVGATVSGTMGKKVTFDLSANPVRLETGAAELRLVADIVGGSGETFDFQIRRAADVRFVDADLNAAITVTGSLSAATANNVEGVALSVTRAANSPTANVAVDATSVKWGSFEFRATGDDLKIEQITASTTAAGASGLDNGKIFLNGVQVGSTQDIAQAGTAFSLGSQMVIKRGTVAVVDIYADAKKAAGTSFSDGNTVQVAVSVATADTQGIQSGDRLTTAISNVLGNTVTISSSSLTATKYSGYSNQTMIAGTNDAKIGSFTLSTGSTEGVNVNTIIVNFASAVSSTLSDIRLVDNATGTQIGTTKSAVSTGDNSFSVSGINLAASATKTINVVANIKSGANAGALPAVTVTTSTGGIGAVTGNSVTVASAPTLQTITVGSAVLTAAVNTGATPDSVNVLANTAEVKVGSFRFTAQYSDYTVQDVRVKIPADAATSVTAVTLKKGSTVLGTQALTLSSGAAQTHATATFTGLSFMVPKNETADLDVYVGIPTIASGAQTGAAISVALDGDEGFKAVDSSGASDTTLTGSASDLSSVSTGKGTMYVRKSVPTLSAVALDNTVFTPGSSMVIGRVKVTADTAGDIGWKKMVFAISKSNGVTLGATSTILLRDTVSGNTIAGNFATSTNAVVSGLEAFATAATSGNLAFVATDEQQIAAGSSKTYELVAGTLATGGTGLQYVSVSVPQTSTSATTAAFSTISTAAYDVSESVVWTDRSSINTVHSEATTDWTNDYLVKTLPLTIGNRTATI
jgi:hypothetical protein